MDWLYVYPKGIRDVLLYIKEKYNNPNIFITENGKLSTLALAYLFSVTNYPANILVSCMCRIYMFNFVGYAYGYNASTPIEEARKDNLRIRYHHDHLWYLLKAIK